jgi:hypothetical protein
LFVTRYAPGKKVHLSRRSAAGNLARQDGVRLRNAPNLLRKFPEFEASPGHQNAFRRLPRQAAIILKSLESQAVFQAVLGGLFGHHGQTISM